MFLLTQFPSKNINNHIINIYNSQDSKKIWNNKICYSDDDELITYLKKDFERNFFLEVYYKNNLIAIFGAVLINRKQKTCTIFAWTKSTMKLSWKGWSAFLYLCNLCGIRTLFAKILPHNSESLNLVKKLGFATIYNHKHFIAQRKVIHHDIERYFLKKISLDDIIV